MREIRSSGSAEGVMSNHDPYSDKCVARRVRSLKGHPKRLITRARSSGRYNLADDPVLR